MGVQLGGDDTGTAGTVPDENKTLAPIPQGSFEAGEPPSAVGEIGQFEDVAAGVGFEYEADYRAIGLLTRSGVYVVDFDNDGYEDVLAIGGAKPVLFENTGGKFQQYQTFEREDARVAHFLDYDNDGWRDLIIGEYGGDLVFYENDRGTYRQRDVGLTSVSSPTSITSADFDGNGCLDLFVGQNGLWQQGHPMEARHARNVAENHPEVRPETEPGGSNFLFYGDCAEFSFAPGLAGIYGMNWTLAVSAADFTGDGYPDIHVGNDFSADFLYVNNGNGTFERRDMGPSTDRNAMSSVVADVNGDHHLDLLVTNIYFTDEVESKTTERDRMAPVPEGNNLFVNDGTGTFTDVAPEHGVHKGGWGWSAIVADFNNDGHLDILHGTSKEVPVEPYDEYRPLQLWKGTPDSWERVDSERVGVRRHESRGIAQIDYDNDGRLDFVVATTPIEGGGEAKGTTPFALYENQHEDDSSLQLFVRNPDGLERNAAVYVETDKRVIYRSANAGSNFLSQNSRLLHVGLGNEELRSVHVFWPDGSRTVYDDSIETGNRYILTPDGVELVETVG